MKHLFAPDQKEKDVVLTGTVFPVFSKILSYGT
jgi:hypothetical protein